MSVDGEREGLRILPRFPALVKYNIVGTGGGAVWEPVERALWEARGRTARGWVLWERRWRPQRGCPSLVSADI